MRKRRDPYFPLLKSKKRDPYETPMENQNETPIFPCYESQNETPTKNRNEAVTNNDKPFSERSKVLGTRLDPRINIEGGGDCISRS
ncbi:hypothetical protein ES703_21657 [subsurface metagenome]